MLSQHRSVERFAEINAELIWTAAELSTVGSACASIGRPDLSQAARTHLEHLANGAFVLAIVGEFKRGKSTLANALLGAEVMPSDVLPTTAVVNRVVYGRASEATLRYRDGRDERIPIERLADYVTKLDEESASRAAALDEAVVAFPTQLCRHNVELLDTPGLGDEAAMTARTVEAIAGVDAAVVVTSALSPFSQSEACIVQNLTEHVDPSRLFFVVGQIDLLEASAVDRLVAGVERRIREAFPPWSAPLRIFPVSAREALYAKLERDDVRLRRSRFDVLEQALESFLVRNRGVVVVQVANEALSGVASALGAAARERLSAIEQDEARLDRELTERVHALERLGSDAAQIASDTDRRHQGFADGATAELGQLSGRLVERVEAVVAGLQFGEDEVTHSQVRHQIVERYLAPPLNALLSETLRQVEDALTAWTARELEVLSELGRRLDLLLAQDGTPTTSVVEAAGDAVDAQALLGDCLVPLSSLPEEFKLSYVPASVAGSVRSLMADVAGVDLVKRTWLRFQGSDGQQLLKERTEMMARLQKQDYVRQLTDVIGAELKRLDPPTRCEAVCRNLRERLVLKIHGQTALVRKVCEIRPWELRVARQSARAERQREVALVRNALGLADQARESAAGRLSFLTGILTSDHEAAAKQGVAP